VEFEKCYAPLLKRAELIASGAINPASPWTRYTNGGRAYYERDETWERTLEEPADGVKGETVVPDENFEQANAHLLKKKKMTEEGLLNSASAWRRLTNGGRAFYYQQDTGEHSLEAPAQGVYDEVALPDEQFEPGYQASA